MAQTISELEKERAELLQAIESQAQQFSNQRSAAPEAPIEHTLKDWLNAAEEVMPVNPRTTANRNSTNPTNNKSAAKPAASSKASFFGVIIMLSLLLTILGVLYIAYTSIHNELQKVMTANKNMNEVFTNLQTQVDEIKNASGQSTTFEELQTKVLKLEGQVIDLKLQLTEVSSRPVVVNATPASVVSGNPDESTPTSVGVEPNWVNMDQLDKKLEAYTQQIDHKLELIMQHLNIQQLAPAAAQSVAPQPNVFKEPKAKLAEKEFETLSIAEPEEPKFKPLNQPLVKLVKTVVMPETPNQPGEPLKNYSPEVNWLMNEPAFNFTLQLASLSDYSSAQKMKDEKGLTDSKIIPQTRNNVTTYVLLVGSYADRSSADQASRSLKSNHNISPWVRKIKDLTSKVE